MVVRSFSTSQLPDTYDEELCRALYIKDAQAQQAFFWLGSLTLGKQA